MSFKWNVFAKRLFVISSLLVLCMLSTFVDTAKPASAATVSSQPAATTCFGGAAVFNNVTILDTTFGPFFTTSRCNDINLRFTQPTTAVFVDVCWTRHNFCRSRDFGLTL